MSLDFTVPRNLQPEVERSLFRLVSDFQEGYLTEKGYIKKRHEILESLNLNVHNIPNVRGDSRVDPRHNSTLSRISTSAESTFDHTAAQDFYYSPSETQVDGSTGSPSEAHISGLDADAYEYYKSHAKSENSGVPKELQRPLDPRVLEQYIQTATFDNLAMLLRKRGTVYAKDTAIIIMDQRGKETQTLTWDKLYLRAEKVAKQIKTKAALYPGDRVCIIYQNIEVIDFLVALYGCLLSGTVAVPMNSGLPVKDMVKIMTDTQSHLCLMSESVYKHFEKLTHKRKTPLWPKGVEVWKTSDMGTYQPSKKEGPPPLKVSDLAYIEYSRGSTSELRGVAISHRTIIHQMTSLASILSSNPDIKNGTLIRPASQFTRLKHMLLSTLDVRESIGLIIGALFTIYSGNTLIWAHQRTTEVPGLYAHIISKFKVSILLSDYLSLKQVAYNYQSFPQLTRTFNKKVKVNLSSVKWCLINTMTVDCEFDDKLSDRWFKPLGHPNPRKIIAPMLSLSEHGGAIISIRDWIGHEDHLGCVFQKPMTDEVIANDENEDGTMTEQLSEVLIDKESLTTNTVKIVSDRPPPTSSTYDDESSKYIRVGAFGYPVPDATLAVVNPEGKMLSGTMEVGEIWVDSHCISGGYWGLPEETQSIFQAECSDYEGILNLNFVRTGLLGFIYSGNVYILGLYEDRINQDVTWYDKYLEIQSHNQKSTSTVTTEPNTEATTTPEEKSVELQTHITPGVTQYRYHYASHLVRTLVRNIPEVTDCSFFNVKINNEYLPVAIIESSSVPLSKEKNPIPKVNETALNDMTSQAFMFIESVHKVRLFCVMITAPNTLPRIIRSGRLEIANMLCKRRFMEGRLFPTFVRFNFANSLATIHHGDDLTGGIWSRYSSQIRVDALSYAQLQYSGIDMRDNCTDDRKNMELSGYKSLVDILKVRVSQQPDELAFALIDGGSIKELKPLSWKKFENRVFAVCSYILEKKNLMAGDNVILVYHMSEEYVICLYACWFAGLVVIPIPPLDATRADEDTKSYTDIIKEYDVRAVFVSGDIEQSMKSKPISAKLKQLVNGKRMELPKYRNTSKHTKSNISSKSMLVKLENYRKRLRKTKRQECLLWITWNADHTYKGARLTFGSLLSLAMNLKETCQMSSLKPIVACVRHTAGLGFLQAAVMGIYLGCTTYLFSSVEYGANPTAFWISLSKYSVENVFVTSKMLVYATRTVISKRCDLSNLKNLMIGWEGRPDSKIMDRFKEAFQQSNLPSTALSNIYQHLLNPLITMRSFLSFEPVNLWLDPLALAQGYISLVNPQDYPDSIEVQDSGIVSINTQIAVVNPETRQLCKVGELGEIWVYSQSTLSGLSGSANTRNTNDITHGTIENWNSEVSYLRTGDFGFLHSVHKNVTQGDNPVELQLLFNLGKIEESFEVLGLQYLSSDIESTLEQFRVILKACVFKTGNYVVAVLETSMKKNHCSIVPLIVMRIMNKFRLIIDVVSFVASGRMPISRLEKVQRTTILKRWMDGTLRLSSSYGINFGEGSTVKTLKLMEETNKV
ncbi:hypothetical protein FOA43_000306 [Brettanomyces nanus]|uniref:Uncharacterized protein n=1 Tax=Eeniella nana TaxID=13502 RepID=A0A875RYL1_EENNA|nr:uncharacterized protein FOA43_000306 [Brettanomyces nanus]QPG73002.1 hypothetical protein FOA43_000306 [Brettanomyces nanus]